MINSKAKEKKKKKSNADLAARISPPRTKSIWGSIVVPSQRGVFAAFDPIPLQRRTIAIEIYETVQLESESTLV